MQAFRTDCLRELKKIKLAWPELNYSTAKGVLILHPLRWPRKIGQTFKIALVVFVAFSGSDVVRAIELYAWMELVDAKLLLSLTLPLATLILDGIVPSEFKAVLVYWKWKNTLPGHEAFTVHGKRDTGASIPWARA